MKQTLKLLLKIAGSVAIIYFLVKRIDWDVHTFTEIYQSLDLPWFLLSLTGVVLVLGLKSIRWNKLLRFEGCKYPYINAFSDYMVSLMIGLITPGRVGEIAKLYYVRQHTGIDFYHSFKTIVTDRIFDFALLIWFGLAGMLYFYKVLGDFSGAIYAVIAAVIMLAGWFSVFSLLRYIKSEKSYIVFLRESWNEMFHKKMIVPWLLTFVAYLASYGSVYFIFKSISIEISIIDIAFVLSLMSLVTLIPITLAGFGTREVSLVYLLGFYGISPEQAVVFSILQFLAFFLWGGFIGLIFWIRNPLKLSLIVEDSKKVFSYVSRKGRNTQH